MLISIIVPVHNSEKYLKRCLDSIIAQSYKNIEIIIIDDGSTDTSNEICKEYSLIDNRIKMITIKNSGVSNARNKGLNIAKGEYIAFVDSDDTIDKKFIETMYEYCQKYDSKLCAVNLNYCYKNQLDRPLKMKTGVFNKEQYYILLIKNVKGFVCNKLYHKSLINNIRFNSKISICEDLLFNIEIATSVKNIVVINEYLYNYFQNNEGTYNNTYNSKRISEIYAYDRIIKLVNNNCPEALLMYKYEYLIMAINQKNKYKKAKYNNKEEYKIIEDSIKKYYKEIMSSKQIKLIKKIYIILCNRYSKLIEILKHIKRRIKCLA